MGDFINWATFFCSIIVATVISLATFLVDIRRHKQDSITQSITANRINWISNVRTLISEFLYAYIEEQSKKDLIKLMGKIRLYFHNESAYYQDFFACLKKCCEEPYSEEQADELIQQSQIILKSAWVRIKVEGGQSKEDDLRIRELVEEYMKYLSSKSKWCQPSFPYRSARAPSS